MTRGLVVPVDGPIEVRDVDGLAAMQAVVGGYIEPFDGPGWLGYCNEEGKLDNLPNNPRATTIAIAAGWERMPGDYLAGDVVFFGPYDLDGENTDVDDAILRHTEAAR